MVGANPSVARVTGSPIEGRGFTDLMVRYLAQDQHPRFRGPAQGAYPRRLYPRDPWERNRSSRVQPGTGTARADISNGVFLTLIVGLFMLNRLGYVSIAAILTTTTMTVGPVVFLSQQDLAETYIVMCARLRGEFPDRALGRAGGGRHSGAGHPGLGRRFHHLSLVVRLRDRKLDRILPGQHRRQRLPGESLPGTPRFP